MYEKNTLRVSEFKKELERILGRNGINLTRNRDGDYNLPTNYVVYGGKDYFLGINIHLVKDSSSKPYYIVSTIGKTYEFEKEVYGTQFQRIGNLAKCLNHRLKYPIYYIGTHTDTLFYEKVNKVNLTQT